MDAYRLDKSIDITELTNFTVQMVKVATPSTATITDPSYERTETSEVISFKSRHPHSSKPSSEHLHLRSLSGITLNTGAIRTYIGSKMWGTLQLG